MSEESTEVIQEESVPQSTPAEDKAREMGWVPEAEFKGDPAKWRSAEEFVKAGESYLPILKDRIRKQDKELADLKRTISDFAEHHSHVEKKAFERALKELKSKQLEAVETGNTDAFVKIDKEIAELQADVRPVKKATDDPHDPVFEEWTDKNNWFKEDREMADYAEAIGAFLKKKNPNLVGMDFLNEVTKSVKKEFPSKFQNPKRDSAPSVESTSAPTRKGGKGYSDLPDEAKKACDRFVRDGIFKTKDDYVKSYFAE